jgi:hypothetical protein
MSSRAGDTPSVQPVAYIIARFASSEWDMIPRRASRARGLTGPKHAVLCFLVTFDRPNKDRYRKGAVSVGEREMSKALGFWHWLGADRLPSNRAITTPLTLQNVGGEIGKLVEGHCPA